MMLNENEKVAFSVPWMNPDFAILLFEAWTSDPSIIYFLLRNETRAHVSVKCGNTNLEGIHPNYDDVINWNSTDSVYSAAFSCSFGICLRDGKQDIQNQFLTFSTSQPTRKQFDFLCSSRQITVEARKDETRLNNLPNVWQHLNCIFVGGNSIQRKRKGPKVYLHLLENTTHCKLTLFPIHLFPCKRNFSSKLNFHEK